MTKYIYAFRNVKSGNFGNPTIEVITKDNAVEAFSVSAKEAPDSQKLMLAELDLYYLGSYDTKTGCIEHVEPEFLISLKEVVGDGQKDN